VRLGTWNCQTGFDSKWESIERLNADVLTIQECGPDTKDQVEAREGWKCEWQVGRYRKGLAVLARFPFTIKETEKSEPCVLSTSISGPGGFGFRFVGFWAMTPSRGGTDTYPQQATDLIGQLPDDGTPTVVSGDFNASWRNHHHLRNVADLASRGLVNAYSFYKIADDARPYHPTSYFQWNKTRQYHMDFVFVPESWSIQSVEVGSFEDYPGRRLSDHVPVIVSVTKE
jgi:exonuclease III